MASIVATPLAKSLVDPSGYRDRAFPGTPEAYDHAIATSTTVYVGNMSFFTTEEQVYAVFRTCGEIKRIIMGLNKHEKTPCGFCFVEYYERRAALDAVRFIGGLKLDERSIRVDLDWGFMEGRQYGRGKRGGQVRDDFRTDFDPGRGGWGSQIKEDEQRLAGLQSTYNDYYQGGAKAMEGAKESFSSAGKKSRQREDDDDEENPRFRRERHE